MKPFRWYILNEELEPVGVDVLIAGQWMDDKKNNAKRIVDCYEEGDVVLSTVFLGLDHSWSPDKVLLYESMWFGGPFDGESRRYSTRQEAEKGHQEMLAKYRNQLSLEETQITLRQIAKEIAERCLND